MSKKKKPSAIDYMKIAIPVSGAVALIILAISFIIYKIVSEYNYNERWKDYDECGLS